VLKGRTSIKPSVLFLLVPFILAAVLTGNLPDQCLPVDGGIIYRYTREQLVSMYPGFFFFTGPREVKKVALTFDDGPDDQATPQILNILKENSVKGTFFLIGKHAQMHPDTVRRIAAEGHVLANHTWSHPNMMRLNPDQARQEIEATQELLERLTGRRTALVRLPWGTVSTDIMDLVQKDGYRVIGWSADSFDWREPRAAVTLARLKAQIHPGAIILMHAIVFPNSNGVTVKILPALISELKAQGYQFVTVDELLHIPAYRTSEKEERRPAFAPQTTAPSA